jgi:hypothetical protein
MIAFLAGISQEYSLFFMETAQRGRDVLSQLLPVLTLSSRLLDTETIFAEHKHGRANRSWEPTRHHGQIDSLARTKIRWCACDCLTR